MTVTVNADLGTLDSQRSHPKVSSSLIKSGTSNSLSKKKNTAVAMLHGKKKSRTNKHRLIKNSIEADLSSNL